MSEVVWVPLGSWRGRCELDDWTSAHERAHTRFNQCLIFIFLPYIPNSNEYDHQENITGRTRIHQFSIFLSLK